MKVYILKSFTDACPDQEKIVDVFATREAAKEAAAMLINKHPTYVFNLNYYVMCYPVLGAEKDE